MSVAMLQPCAHCQSTLSVGRAVYSLKNDPLDDIYICETCGLVYKPTCNENASFSNENVYSSHSWNSNLSAHLTRLDWVADYMSKSFPNQLKGKVLDVGAGIGILHDRLRSRAEIGKYVALEPVREIAVQLKSTLPSVFVLNSDVKTASIPDKTFSLILVCGVDYLFQDIRECFSKISRWLADDGVVFIQRNVFLDQKSYVAKPINSLNDLFSDNNLIRNWFHSEQYSEFVSQFFHIEKVIRMSVDHKNQTTPTSYFMNYVCTRRRISESMNAEPVRSYYAQNRAIIDRLRGAVPNVETA